MWRLSVALLAACCAQPAMRGDPPFPIAYTQCVGADQPIAWIRIDVLVTQPVIAEAAVAHESAHARQIRRMGCDAFRRLSDAEAARNEAEAFCYSAEVFVRRGYIADPTEAIRYVARILAEQYPGFGLSHESAEQLVREFCREGSWIP